MRVKADYPGISDDLVNSYHLLQACIDLIYANVVLGNRCDLLKDGRRVQRVISSYDPPSILEW